MNAMSQMREKTAAPAGSRFIRNRLVLSAVLAVVFAFGSYLIGGGLTATATYALYWAAMAVTYDLFSGYSGRINMGFAMFPGLAGYISAYCSSALGLPVWGAIVLAILGTIVVAVVFGMITLRIQGVYFALASSLLPLVLIQFTNIFSGQLGGEDGLYGVQRIVDGGGENLALATVMLVVITGISIFIVRNKPGLLIRAVKGGETTARSLGINTYGQLLTMFTIGGGLAALAGIGLVHFQMIVTPDLLFITTTLQIILFVEIGGSATLIGPLIAAIAFTVLDSKLQPWPNGRLLIEFAILVLVLRFMPGGVVGFWRRLRHSQNTSSNMREVNRD